MCNPFKYERKLPTARRKKKEEVVVEQGGKEGINYANNTKDFTT